SGFGVAVDQSLQAAAQGSSYRHVRLSYPEIEVIRNRLGDLHGGCSTREVSRETFHVKPRAPRSCAHPTRSVAFGSAPRALPRALAAPREERTQAPFARPRAALPAVGRRRFEDCMARSGDAGQQLGRELAIRFGSGRARIILQGRQTMARALREADV